MAYAVADVLAFEPRNGEGVSATQPNFGEVQRIIVFTRVADMASSETGTVYLEDSADGINWFPVTYFSLRNGNIAWEVERGVASNIRVRYKCLEYGKPSDITLGVSIVSS